MFFAVLNFQFLINVKESEKENTQTKHVFFFIEKNKIYPPPRQRVKTLKPQIHFIAKAMKWIGGQVGGGDPTARRHGRSPPELFN